MCDSDNLSEREEASVIVDAIVDKQVCRSPSHKPAVLSLPVWFHPIAFVVQAVYCIRLSVPSVSLCHCYDRAPRGNRPFYVVLSITPLRTTLSGLDLSPPAMGFGHTIKYSSHAELCCPEYSINSGTILY